MAPPLEGRAADPIMSYVFLGAPAPLRKGNYAPLCPSNPLLLEQLVDTVGNRLHFDATTESC